MPMKFRKFKKPARKPLGRRPVRSAYGKPAVRRRSNLKARAVRRVARPKRIQGGILTSSMVMIPSTHGKRASPQVARAIKMVGSPNVFLAQVPQTVTSIQQYQAYGSFAHLPMSSLLAIRQAVNTGPGAIRYVVETYMSEMTFTNTSTAPCELELWDVCLKKDLTTAWTYTAGTNTYTIFPEPTSYWASGSLIQAGLPVSSGIGVRPANQIGSTPYDSQLFTSFFEVKKRTLITMPSGSTHRHSVFMKPNYLVKDSEVQNSGLIAGVSGLTSFTLYAINGFPTGNDFDGTTYSGSQVSAVNSSRTKYGWSADLSQTLYRTGPDQVSATLDIVNIGSGLVETQTFT